MALIRWSATIASNVLAEHKGPRLGLLVSAGHERDLYGEGESPALGEVIDPQNVSEVSDPRDLGRVLEVVRALLERGVRRICVSLEGSLEDNGDELAVKDLVEQQFPDHYLGSVPLVPGSELCPHPDANTRTHVALVNAYVHTPLAATLFKAEDELISEHG